MTGQNTPTTVVAVTPKNIGTAYLWWLFFGALGAHQFYLGKTGRAVGMMLTFGWLTLGLWIDLVTLPRQVREVNAELGLQSKPTTVPLPEKPRPALLEKPLEFPGYGIDVTWDGNTLRVHGRNKFSRIALAGQDHEHDVVLTRNQIATANFRAANPAINGALTLTTTDGRQHILHFRRKHRRDFEALAGDLGAP